MPLTLALRQDRNRPEAQHLTVRSVVTVENRAQGNDIAHDSPIALGHEIQLGHKGRTVTHDMQQVVLRNIRANRGSRTPPA